MKDAIEILQERILKELQNSVSYELDGDLSNAMACSMRAKWLEFAISVLKTGNKNES